MIVRYFVNQASAHCTMNNADLAAMRSMHVTRNGSRPRGRPKKTWKEVVREDCQARKLNKEDAMDRCK